MLNDQQLATTIVSKAWSLTVGGLSDIRTLAEPSCLGTGIDPETDTEIGGLGDNLYPNAAVGA